MAMMDWLKPCNRQALLELYSLGFLKRRQSQKECYEYLYKAGFATLTGRSNEIGLIQEKRPALGRLLDRVWPEWKAVDERIGALGLKPGPEAFKRLSDARAAEREVDLDGRLFLHEKTAQALYGMHSKAALPADFRLPSGLILTRDETIRLRPCPGLRMVTPGGFSLDVHPSAEANGGEYVMTERAFLSGVRFEADSPPFVILVENRGAYLDMPMPKGAVLIHCPGWDTRLSKTILSVIPFRGLGLFGDLDPAGIDILVHLKAVFPEVRWFSPDLYLRREPLMFDEDSKGWNPSMDFPPEVPSWLKTHCVQSNVWYEQEGIVCERELKELLEAWIKQ
jgi:hypothetical protein